MFKLNVILCATVFRHMRFYKNWGALLGRALWAGFIRRDVSLQCKDVLGFFLTLGAPQHLRLCFDFCAISDVL